MAQIFDRFSGNQPAEADTIVGVGSRLKGEIVCKGPTRIAGAVDGDLSGDDRIIIAPEADITGTITATEIEVDGCVKGTIEAKSRIVLNETANVEGDIHAPSVIIEQGAVFNGTSHMPTSERSDDTTAEKADNVLSIDRNEPVEAQQA